MRNYLELNEFSDIYFNYFYEKEKKPRTHYTDWNESWARTDL